MGIKKSRFYSAFRSEGTFQKIRNNKNNPTKAFFLKTSLKKKNWFWVTKFSVLLFYDIPSDLKSASNSGFLTPIFTYFVKNKLFALKH
jgi:hypothetical protein